LKQVQPVAAIEGMRELNIGHFMIGEAIFEGLENVIRKMRGLIDTADSSPAVTVSTQIGGAVKMILGIGSDLTDIRRITQSLEKYEDPL
jgi:hypothetical protein